MKRILQIAFWLVITLAGTDQIFSQDIPFNYTTFTEQGDLSVKMVEGIRQFMKKKMEEKKRDRTIHWMRELHGDDSDKFLSRNRTFLKDRLGVIQERDRPKMVLMVDSFLNPMQVDANDVVIQAVRWNVKEGLYSEGLYLKPKLKIRARIILIPDADEIPEDYIGVRRGGKSWSDIALRLSSQGFEVLIPTLINRKDTWSGNPRLNKWTNQPHREWLYRQSYELGRHLIGEEIHKILSGVDWFKNQIEGDQIPIGVMGYGEGGLLAFFAGAIDERITSTMVSGYFNQREEVWKEPIYRNTFGILGEMGDAEIATLFYPRSLTVEHSHFPQVPGPPEPAPNRRGAAPGAISTPVFSDVEKEWNQVKNLRPDYHKATKMINAFQGNLGDPFTSEALRFFSKGLGIVIGVEENLVGTISLSKTWINPQDRQERLVRNMQMLFQQEMNRCEISRDTFFWDKIENVTGDEEIQQKEKLRKKLWETLGRLPDPDVPMTTRARMVETNEKWTRYEVVLPVWSDVFAWGLLTVPKGIQPGEKGPVIICQHGLEGLPHDVVITDKSYRKYPAYKGYATQLAEQGYITFAPHNPYRGGDKFRVLQRMANPIGYSLFSVIIGQHQRILEWLKSLDFVDKRRIGFYGLSYGGKTAMRIPAVLEGYALSICSGDFNEWIRKNVSVELRYSYMYAGEYEISEWNLGQTFNYAEMAALIAPRPFMIEFGYRDGIGSVEWVNYEFGKVRRHYDLNGLSHRLDKDFFDGPHSIHGLETFRFLDEQLSK